jgi:glycosyltransferase involved in cell wall biosynthesis
VKPRVSFVVPCYNYGRYVRQAIDSLLGQTFEALEVIAVDDNSTDDTAAVLATYAGNPRVRVVRHDRNYGPFGSYNDGLALAQGEYTGVMDADDFAARPDAVARQVAILDANPDVGFVYFPLFQVDESGAPLQTLRLHAGDYVRDGLEVFPDFFQANCLPHSGVLVRQSAREAVGDYDLDLPHAADWDLFLRLSARFDVAYIDDPLYTYRIHGDNRSSTKVTPQQITDEFLATVEKNYRGLAPDVQARLTGAYRAAQRSALLSASWNDRAFGRIRRSVAGLVYAARRSPSLLTAPVFYTSIARLIVLAALGHERYVRLAQWRKDRAPAAPAPIEGATTIVETGETAR